MAACIQRFAVALVIAFALSSSACVFAGEAEWRAHMDAGAAANQRGDYGAAERSFTAAINEAEMLGENDSRLAATLNNLALLYEKQGRHAEAEPLYRRSLAIVEKTLGPDHLQVDLPLS